DFAEETRGLLISRFLGVTCVEFEYFFGLQQVTECRDDVVLDIGHTKVLFAACHGLLLAVSDHTPRFTQIPGHAAALQVLVEPAEGVFETLDAMLRLAVAAEAMALVREADEGGRDAENLEGNKP